MKNTLFTSLIMFAALTSFAQNIATQATLTINIADIKTIEVLGTKNVNINIETSADYVNAATSTGVTTSMAGHLKVTSSGGFKVTAKAADLVSSGSGETIPANNIFLNITGYESAVSNVMAGYASVTDLNLNNMAATLISTSTISGGTPQTIFDIDYTLKNVTNIANLSSGSYTTQVIYTIETN